MPLSIGCTARPGKARGNRTGSWRVFKPRFNREACTSCGLCAMICPESCVHRTKDDQFEPDYEFCKGCGLCARECPAKGIEMEREEK